MYFSTIIRASSRFLPITFISGLTVITFVFTKVCLLAYFFCFSLFPAFSLSVMIRSLTLAVVLSDPILTARLPLLSGSPSTMPFWPIFVSLTCIPTSRSSGRADLPVCIGFFFELPSAKSPSASRSFRLLVATALLAWPWSTEELAISLSSALISSTVLWAFLIISRALSLASSRIASALSSARESFLSAFSSLAFASSSLILAFASISSAAFLSSSTRDTAFSKSIWFSPRSSEALSIIDSLRPSFLEISKALDLPGSPILSLYVGDRVSTLNSIEAFSTPSVERAYFLSSV